MLYEVITGKKMIKILLSLLLSLTISFAAESFKLNPEKVQVNWEAYKTLAKLGVKGTFNTVKLSTPTEARELSQVLNGVSVTIDTTSVNTQNPGRITSYNVCYTKLLRRARHQRQPHRARVPGCWRRSYRLRCAVADGDRLVLPGHQHPDPG